MTIKFSINLPEWPWVLRIIERLHPGLMSSVNCFGRAAASREVLPGVTVDTKIERVD